MGLASDLVSSVQWSEAALFWAIFISAPSLLSLHQFMRWILKFVSKHFQKEPTSAAAASITIIIISNKIALFNNSSSRIYPFIYQHADHIFNIILHVLDDPFQSGSHPLFLQSVRRVISASLQNVNVTRTTQRISGTTPWPARRTSSRHARRVSARARSTPRASSGPGARGSHVARVIWRPPVTTSPQGWTATCLALSTVSCRKLKVIIISRVSPVLAAAAWLHDFS